MSLPLTLPRLRDQFALPWLVLVSGVVFLLSQLIIAATLAPVGAESVLRLQLTFHSAEQYLQQFGLWQEQGVLGAYAAHLVPDTLHPLWYGLFATSLMAWSLQRRQASQRWNLFLPLPALSALLDVLENSIQNLFLLQPVTLTDGLARLSWLCSVSKWLLVLVYGLVILFWLVPRAYPR